MVEISSACPLQHESHCLHVDAGHRKCADMPRSMEMSLGFKWKQSHEVRGAVLEGVALELTGFLSLFFCLMQEFWRLKGMTTSLPSDFSTDPSFFQGKTGNCI